MVTFLDYISKTTCMNQVDVPGQIHDHLCTQIFHEIQKLPIEQNEFEFKAKNGVNQLLAVNVHRAVSGIFGFSVKFKSEEEGKVFYYCGNDSQFFWEELPNALKKMDTVRYVFVEGYPSPLPRAALERLMLTGKKPTFEAMQKEVTLLMKDGTHQVKQFFLDALAVDSTSFKQEELPFSKNTFNLILTYLYASPQPPIKQEHIEELVMAAQYLQLPHLVHRFEFRILQIVSNGKEFNDTVASQLIEMRRIASRHNLHHANSILSFIISCAFIERPEFNDLKDEISFLAVYEKPDAEKWGKFCQLKQVKTLFLDPTVIDPSLNWNAFNGTSVEFLGITEPVTNATISLLRHFPRLNQLRVDIDRLDDEAMASIKDLPLTELWLINCHHVSEDALRTLGNMRLNSVVLRNCSNQLFRQFASFKELKSFKLETNNEYMLTQEDIETLSNLDSLEELQLRGTRYLSVEKCTDLSVLEKLRSLKSVDLRRCAGFDKETLQFLHKIPGLKVAHLQPSALAESLRKKGVFVPFSNINPSPWEWLYAFEKTTDRDFQVSDCSDPKDCTQSWKSYLNHLCNHNPLISALVWNHQHDAAARGRLDTKGTECFENMICYLIEGDYDVAFDRVLFNTVKPEATFDLELNLSRMI